MHGLPIEDEVNRMSITMRKLLQKMDQELQSAKSADSETRIRERIQAIKTLCELVLEEPEAAQHSHPHPYPQPQRPLHISNTQPMTTTSPALSLAKTEPTKIDNGEANGESLFDF